MMVRWTPWSVVVVIAALSFCVAGCSDGKYKARQAAREERMREHLAAYATYDASGLERMQWIKDLSEELRARHEKQLDEMLKRVDEAYERDLERWNENTPQRQEWSKALGAGKPTEIKETWGNMVYP